MFSEIYSIKEFGGCFEMKVEDQSSLIQKMKKKLFGITGSQFTRLQYNLTVAMQLILPEFRNKVGFVSLFDIGRMTADETRLSFSEAFELIYDVYRCFHRSFFERSGHFNREAPKKVSTVPESSAEKRNARTRTHEHAHARARTHRFSGRGEGAYNIYMGEHTSAFCFR